MAELLSVCRVSVYRRTLGLFMDLNSQIVHADDRSFWSSREREIGARLRRAARQLSALATRFDEYMLTLTETCVAADSIVATLAPIVEESVRPDDAGSVDFEHSPEPVPGDGEYDKYDAFFAVTRTNQLNFDIAAGELAKAISWMLLDLPYSHLDAQKGAVLLQATAAAADGLASFGPDVQDLQLPASAPSPYDTARTRQEFDLAWAANDSAQAFTEAVADYRWFAGHYLFFLFSVYCLNAIQAAERALPDADAFAERITAATTFTRGTTMAMWYAIDFPPAVYRGHTRDWMRSAGAENGFSGTDNLEYVRLNASIKSLLGSLRSSWGAKISGWPAPARDAFLEFHEAGAIDKEHHILIAERTVGSAPSLMQENYSAHAMSATAALRALLKRWNGMLDRFAG